jgi:DNA-binding MarR family transcriptional regulator
MSYKSIDQVINQEKFSSTTHKCILNIFYTSNYFRDIHTRIFKQYNIQSQHYNILRILKGKHPNPVQIGYIKEVMLDKGCDLTRLLDKLEKMALIIRCVEPTNKRKVNVSLTPKAIELLSAMKEPMETINKNFEHRLNDEELTQLSNLLDKLRNEN